VRHLYRAVLALSNDRTAILVANERRSESVQAAFIDLFSPSFTFKKVEGGRDVRMGGWGGRSSAPVGVRV
jgi:hypothetical protein